MSGFIRTATVAGVMGATALLAVPTASATPTASGSGQAAPECVTDSQTHTYGRGEIKICVENGQARVTGWLEDLLPGGGWGAPDGGCVTWWVTFRTTSGTELDNSVMACPHFGGAAYKEFDYDSDVQNITGVEKMNLGTAWA
ncbi:hypothetical protein [Streptomyces sp. NBC_00385]|uniref:hypothetical protein n=1 Tax=Streptomyces sp. NBC_00385 TaxID=2975733 RepID=UPI002DD8E87B|nr:hypothetical protein [Streptomyces sp. NBC_00385]WRZ04178.1 hypothetical protein OG959_12830 [Streptomyces sp. NBC_00385]